jgi:peptidoglycan hydrolase-like protein with peptidoglycan-binding domain
LQCLLKEKGLYAGRVNGVYNDRTRLAARNWQTAHGFAVRDLWNRPNWMSLLVAGQERVSKWGSAGPEVRRLQRALNAAHDDAGIAVTGAFKKTTVAAVRSYQRRVGIRVNGIAGPSTWKALQDGKR